VHVEITTIIWPLDKVRILWSQ